MCRRPSVKVGELAGVVLLLAADPQVHRRVFRVPPKMRNCRPDIVWDYNGEGKSVRTLEFGGRLLHIPGSVKVGWDNDHGRPCLVTEKAEEEEQPLRDRLLAALRVQSKDEAKSIKDLAAGTGNSEKVVRVVLGDLEQQLEVAWESKGKAGTKFYWRTR